MKTRTSILFVFRRNKAATRSTALCAATGALGQALLLTEDKGCIYCRITVNGTRAVLSTNIRLTRAEWDLKTQRVRGNKPSAVTANNAVTKMRDQITDIWADLERQKRPVTSQAITRIYRADGSVLSLLCLFEAFSAERRALVGVEISLGTLKTNTSRYNRLRDFLKLGNMTDLRPEEFTHSLADKFLYWLLTAQKYQRNTANKVLQTMVQVLRWGVRREHLLKSPLDLYQYKTAATKDIIYLEAAEVAMLSDYRFAVDALAKVRDCFIFQCWTGLAYADLSALNVARDVETRENGRRFLRVTRAKSTMFKGYECVIPLLPEAERILAKYGDILPVFSNQVYNRYLKQVGELTGLGQEKMTTHVGRKTAGTLMLNKGIPLPAVSKFLGHSNVMITQKLYAKLLDTTVLDAFDNVFGGPPTGNGPALMEGVGGRVVQMRHAS